MPGLTIRPFASTADVEALMCSASATQHTASSHLVLSVYAACKDHTTGANLIHSKHSVAVIMPCSEFLQSSAGVDCHLCS